MKHSQTLVAVIAATLVSSSSIVEAKQVALDVSMANPMLLAGKKQTTYLKVGLTGFEMDGIDEKVVEAVWEHAFHVYDQACKEAEPESTTTDNRQLMQSYLLGKRRKAGR